MVERLILAPSERWVVDAFFPDEGEYALEHVSEGKTYRLAAFAVEAEEALPDLSEEFGRLRRNPEFAEERAAGPRSSSASPTGSSSCRATCPGWRWLTPAWTTAA